MADQVSQKLRPLRVVGVRCPTCGDQGGDPGIWDLGWFSEGEGDYGIGAWSVEQLRELAWYCLRCEQPLPIELGPIAVKDAPPHLEPFRLLIATEPIDA